MPALGGTAFIVEAVPDSARTARLTLTVLDGHPRIGWQVLRRRSGRITASRFWRLGALADREMGHAADEAPSADVIIVCTDGPGYRTERVRGGSVAVMRGFCPRGPRIPHPNVTIVCDVQKLLSSTFPGEVAELGSPARCSRRGF